MSELKLAFFFALVLGLFPSPSYAERLKSFFEKSSGAESVAPRKDGYFFYKDPRPEPPIEDFKIIKQSPLQPEQKAEKEPYNGVIPWEKVESMHPDEFQELMMDSLNYAIIDPSDEKRMRDYMTLQMVAIQRSEHFQQSWGKVLTKNPALDPTATRPVSRVASIALAQTTAQDNAAAIAAMRENMGIIVFKREDCSYCKQQSEIMERFVEWWDWKNYEEIDIRQYPDVAAEFGVEIVPDIYLVANFDGEIVNKRLSTGLITRADLQTALLHAYYNWYLGKDYKVPMLEQGDAAFAAHLDSMKKEQRINEEEFKKRVRQGSSTF